jgi:hypothetical protein
MKSGCVLVTLVISAFVLLVFDRRLLMKMFNECALFIPKPLEDAGFSKSIKG